MRLAIRKFIIYPIMDRIFNYKQKPSNIQPMKVRLASHPATSKKLQELDIRTITYDEWLKYIIYAHYIKLWKEPY